jgi:hypothetical protein
LEKKKSEIVVENRRQEEDAGGPGISGNKRQKKEDRLYHATVKHLRISGKRCISAFSPTQDNSLSDESLFGEPSTRDSLNCEIRQEVQLEVVMRHGLLAISVLLLASLWAVAQYSGQSKTSAGGQTTVEGCLSSSGGSYMLTDQNGTMYQLSGDTAKLSEHVGHEIKVSGTSSSADNSASSTGAANGASGSAQPTLQVASVKHISKTCKSGSGMSH